MSDDDFADPIEGEFEPLDSPTPNHPRFTLEEPIQMRATKIGYERKFNLGDYNALTADILIWLRVAVPEGEAFDLHGAIGRTKQMARDNVRAQYLRARGKEEAIFMGLLPPDNGRPDPVYVRTVSVSLTYRVNLGNYDSICPSYTDWADLRHVSHSPGELHMALERMWASLWARTEDEIRRARGLGPDPEAFFGLPLIEVEDLTNNGPADNGTTMPHIPLALPAPVLNGSQHR
jgi:hypothetical protein